MNFFPVVFRSHLFIKGFRRRRKRRIDEWDLILLMETNTERRCFEVASSLDFNREAGMRACSNLAAIFDDVAPPPPRDGFVGRLGLFHRGALSLPRTPRHRLSMSFTCSWRRIQGSRRVGTPSLNGKGRFSISCIQKKVG